MNLSFVKPAVWVALRSLLLLLCATGVYYFFWLLPDQRLARTLTNLENNLAAHYFTLLTNRLSSFEISRLDPSNADFDREKEGIIAHLTGTREQNTALFNDTLSYEASLLASFSRSGRLENDITAQFSQLRTQHESVISGQGRLLEQLDKFEQITDRLSAFQPEYYLNQFQLPEEKNTLAAQLANSRPALTNIKVELERWPGEKTPAMKDFISKLSDTELKLQSLENTLNEHETDTAEEANAAKDEAINAFQNLRLSLASTQASLLKSDEGLALLTTETNVLLGYRHLLSHIDRQQAELYREYSRE